MITTKGTNSHVNLFYFPLNIAVVDDDQHLLNSVSAKLTSNTSQISLYNSPSEAITDINPIELKIRDFIDNSFCNEFDINYNMLPEFIKYCSNKHGIIISDYYMPNISGIELFNRYNGDVVKVLLTEVLTSSEAVEALQDHKISHYIQKEDFNNLAHIINILQHRYFTSLTEKILMLVNVDDYKFLFNDDYIKIFNNICQQLGVIKYHILNGFGNYYLDNGNNRYILTIYSLSDLRDMATDVAEEKRNDVISGNLIPSYFLDDSNCIALIKAVKLGDYCYAIETIEDFRV